MLVGKRATYWSENRPKVYRNKNGEEKTLPLQPSISIRKNEDGLGYEVVKKGSLSGWTVMVVEEGN
jgi:hypothetical protein